MLIAEHMKLWRYPFTPFRRYGGAEIRARQGERAFGEVRTQKSVTKKSGVQRRIAMYICAAAVAFNKKSGAFGSAFSIKLIRLLLLRLRLRDGYLRGRYGYNRHPVRALPFSARI